MSTYTNSAAFVARGAVLAFLSVPSDEYVPLAEIKGVDFSGSKYDLDDVTNFESGNFREFISTLADSGELSFNANYIVTDSSQQALLGFFNTGARVSWQITLPSAANAPNPIQFVGFVTGLDHNLPLDKAASVAVKIKITGAVTGF